VKRRNGINWRFAARRAELPDSPAYRSVSQSGQMVGSCIEIGVSHQGNDDGRPPAALKRFAQCGIRRISVGPAIREAEALGFIHVAERGRGGNAEYRSLNLFCLTNAHHRDSRKYPPTNDRRPVQTLQQANPIARRARANEPVESA
jgi:hypothetical protein